MIYCILGEPDPQSVWLLALEKTRIFYFHERHYFGSLDTRKNMVYLLLLGTVWGQFFCNEKGLNIF
jgi:hypothetical protein